MNLNKPKRVWKIQGWDGTTQLFEHEIYVGQIGALKLQDLIKVLTCKISLTEKEIISNYANKGTKAYSNHLVVEHMEGNKFMYSCGTNPYVIAVAEDENAL